MPKARLEFDLNDPQEESDYFDARHGSNYRYIIDEIQNVLRKHRKYDDFAKEEWRTRSGVFGGVKKRFQKLVDTRAEFFDKLDEELHEIMMELPEQK